MFTAAKSYLESVVSGLLSKYIANLDISALRVSLFSGDVVLRNVELKLEVLRREFAAGLPIQFRCPPQAAASPPRPR